MITRVETHVSDVNRTMLQADEFLRAYDRHGRQCTRDSCEYMLSSGYFIQQWVAWLLVQGAKVSKGLTRYNVRESVVDNGPTFRRIHYFDLLQY